MDIKYTIAGADGQTYGPVSLEELQGWIRDGRVSAQTNVMRSDVNAWHSASQYQELSFATQAAIPPLTSAATAPSRQFVAGQYPDLEKKIKGGASWFYWIAALSMINTISIVSGSNWSFFLGLGVTQIIAAFGRGMGNVGVPVSVILSALACGLFALFGIYANKRHSWAFFAGLILYALDGLIYLVFADWLAFGFHIFAAFCIFVGLKANLDLKKQTGN